MYACSLAWHLNYNPVVSAVHAIAAASGNKCYNNNYNKYKQEKHDSDLNGFRVVSNMLDAGSNFFKNKIG